MLSPFNKQCLQKFDIKHTPSIKLIPNLYDKEKYVLLMFFLKGDKQSGPSEGIDKCLASEVPYDYRFII